MSGWIVVALVAWVVIVVAAYVIRKRLAQLD